MAKVKEKAECRICGLLTALKGKVCSVCRNFAKGKCQVACGPCRGYHEKGERCPKK